MAGGKFDACFIGVTLSLKSEKLLERQKCRVTCSEECAVGMEEGYVS